MIQNILFTKQKQAHRLRKQMYGYCGGRDRVTDWNWYVCTAIFKINNQKGPTL